MRRGLLEAIYEHSQSIIKNNLKTIFVDGTFEYCQKYFTQLFTIHGFENNSYIPFVFCLSKNNIILKLLNIYSK